MDLFKLTRTLIDIPSVSGEEEAVGEFLAAYLRDLNYRVEMQEVERGRANLIAKTEAMPRIIFSTHIDTVPPFIPSSEDDEYIYGRGACDAKGIIAAQIVAVEKLRAEGINEIGLLFVVDEELVSKGARMANTHPVATSCRYLINGEPTDNKLAIGSKGTMRVSLETKGRAAHSAYPEQGESAIEELLDVLDAVRKANWPGDEFFGETTCNIGTIAGGTRPNVIPAEARAELLFRLVTDAETLKQALEGVVGNRASINYVAHTDPVRMHPVEGLEQSIVRFTTDIPHLGNWGTALLLGPGSILVAHTSDERVSKHELTEAVNLYVKLAKSLMKNTEYRTQDTE